MDRLPIGDERRTVAQKNLEVLLSRKDRYMELRRSLQTARGQMDLMENTFCSWLMRSSGCRIRTELGAQLDGLREGVAAVRETSKETERYMWAASRWDDRWPGNRRCVHDDHPEHLEDDPFPVWADEIRRRYLRGESAQFVLFGNVR